MSSDQTENILGEEEGVNIIESVGSVTNGPVASVGGRYISVCEVGDPCRWAWTHRDRERVLQALVDHHFEKHSPEPEPPTREEHVTDWLQGMPQPARALYMVDPEFHAWVRHGARLAQASDDEIAQDPAETVQVVHALQVDARSPLLDRETFDRAIDRLKQQGYQ